MHDSESARVASPSLYESFIHNTLPALTGALNIEHPHTFDPEGSSLDHWLPVVEWSGGADRTSNDADVSIAPSKIPYSGFSPVRLQGQHVR
jgi:hypothetical protein